jgi:hypothetical protein
MNDLDTQSKALSDLPLHNDVAARTHSTSTTRRTRTPDIGTAVLS